MFNPASISKQITDEVQKHLYSIIFEALYQDDKAPDIDIPHDENSVLYADVELLCDAANGNINKESPEFDTGIISDVMDAIERLMNLLHASAWNDSTPALVSDEFWKTNTGQMILQADMWWKGDELITLKEAAIILRGNDENKNQVYIHSLIKKNKLHRYVDMSESNPQKAGRVSKQEVERIKNDA